MAIRLKDKELRALEIINKNIVLIHDNSKDETTKFKEVYLIMFKTNWNYIDISKQEYELLKTVLEELKNGD